MTAGTTKRIQQSLFHSVKQPLLFVENTVYTKRYRVRCFSPCSKEIYMSDTIKIHSALAEAMSARSYDTMTPVQEAVLKIENPDADLLVSAQTGSGKTLAFGLSIATTLLTDNSHFDRPHAPLALIIAPTRELALQVRKELEWLYARTGAQFASCVGGMDPRAERRILETGAHIVVGTPGRLRDHIERGALRLAEVQAVVLDEADEMLDMGFREDLTFILDKAPVSRRTLLFSATVPAQIAKLARTYQKDALQLSVSSKKTQHLDINYHAIKIQPSDRDKAIMNLLRYHDVTGAIVFCNTRAAVTHLASRLNNRGFSVVALSGELSQKERNFALQSMRDGKANVCVATDVAARGIDLPNLDLVIHADLPQSDEAMLHRSGRTGRAGRKGISVVLIPNRNFKRVERMFQNNGIQASWMTPPTADSIIEKDRVKLLQSELLTAPLDQSDAEIVQKIIEKFSPEIVASAFVRSQMAGKSAPEDLNISGSTGPADFSKSTWFELSVGHRDNAEPRWLVAMLCRIGNMDKSVIGDIQIHNSTTFIEIAANGVEQLVSEIKPDYLLEGKIDIKKMSQAPERIPMSRDKKFSSSRRGAPAGRSERSNSNQNFKNKNDRYSKPNHRKENKDIDTGEFKSSEKKAKSNKSHISEADKPKKQDTYSTKLKLRGSGRNEDKPVRSRSAKPSDRNRPNNNNSARKPAGGKAPLRRRRAD